MNRIRNKSIGSLLAVTVISLSTLECQGAAADFSSSRLSDIWQQEFSLPAGKQPIAETKASTAGYPANLHYRNDQPHPTVVRVIVPEEGATSYGSGTLVDLRDQFGLVITNWHVVRDANGMVEVVFPGGFKSKARALKVDPDWDLAALVIWRPPVEPVSIASVAPQPGDQLTICGYGSGMYRSATGRCTQYYAPRLDFPQHMVELDVEARQGDSGGPIFNRRGELAGVLFGAGQGTTLGSFGGRVDSFLASLAPDIGKQTDSLLASKDSPRNDCNQKCRQDGFCEKCEYPGSVEQRPQVANTETPTTEINDRWASTPQNQESLAAMWPKEPMAPGEDAAPPTEKAIEIPQPATTQVAQWQATSSLSSFEQMKTVLAAIGLVSIAVLILRAAR